MCVSAQLCLCAHFLQYGMDYKVPVIVQVCLRVCTHVLMCLYVFACSIFPLVLTFAHTCTLASRFEEIQGDRHV